MTMTKIASHFWAKIDHVVALHKQAVDRPFLQPIQSRWFQLVTVIMLLAAIFAAGHMRQWQLSQWNANPDIFYLDDTPLFSTTDASYFLNSARAIQQDEHSVYFQRSRQYPNAIEAPVADDHSIFDEDLLSVLISKLAPDGSLQSLLQAGHSMLPITAALSALAIIIAFGAAGFWAEGAVAAIGGTLSYAYLVRSSVGRIDTDQLNLGFFYFITGLVIWGAKAKRLWLAIAVTIAAGLVTNLFNWWYVKDVLSWGFLGGLIWLSFAIHRDWRRTLLLAGIFVVTAGTFFSGATVNVSGFTDTVTNVEALKLPNTFGTITELVRVPITEILMQLTGDVWLGVLALIGLGIWTALNPVMAVVFVPALLLGSLNFIFGNRVIFFSAPLIWFGIGILFTTALRLITYRVQKQPKIQLQTIAATVALIAAAATAYFSSGNPLTQPYLPGPSFSSKTMEGFKKLGDYVRSNPIPKIPVVATWWDYGYAATLFTGGMPTLHDGASQKGVPTHLFARAMVSSSQMETAQILKFIANDGVEGVTANAATNASLNQAFMAGPTQDRADVYLVLTAQMGKWMASISSLGLWNMKSGQPIDIGGGSNVVSYQSLQCSGSGSQVNCNGQPFDFSAGTIAGRPLLAGAVKTEAGFIQQQAQYQNEQGIYVQFHTINGQTLSEQVAVPVLHKSTYNQLFYLGQPDPTYFTPVIDGFPHYRIYRVN